MSTGTKQRTPSNGSLDDSIESVLIDMVQQDPSLASDLRCLFDDLSMTVAGLNWNDGSVPSVPTIH